MVSNSSLLISRYVGVVVMVVLVVVDSVVGSR